MKRRATGRNSKDVGPSPDIDVEGEKYVLQSSIEHDLGVSRQTIWRWRTSGKVPAGNVYREKQVVFTISEAREIYDYANRVKPIIGRTPRQLNLFREKGGGDESE
jgi:hypothetical protein